MTKAITYFKITTDKSMHHMKIIQYSIIRQCLVAYGLLISLLLQSCSSPLAPLHHAAENEELTVGPAWADEQRLTVLDLIGK